MTPTLPLDGMDSRHPALTVAIASAYKEAACVCLSRHHVAPVTFSVSDNAEKSQVSVQWKSPDERTKAAWGNEIDTTEAGAYCCVIAGVEHTRGLLAVRRAETKTGADYYIALNEDGREDLENCIRLEVSGTDKGDAAEVVARLKSKLEQAKRGNSNLPAMAGVIGFASKLLMMADMEES